METFLYAESEDQMLPVPIREKREVSWMHGVERFGWLGRKLTPQLVLCDESCWPEKTTINADDIDRLSDKNLRYALRFADAANTAGSIRDSKYSSHWLDVRVVATDEGMESRLLGKAWYSGRTDGGIDTFMEDLKRFAPEDK